MIVTSASLDRIEGELVALASSLLDQETAARQQLGPLEDQTDSVAGAWGGPRPTMIINAIGDYMATIRAFPGAVASARATVDGWASAAATAAESMRTTENRIASLQARLGTDEETPADRGDLSLLAYVLEEAVAEWKLMCTSKGTELDTAIQEIDKCNKAIAFRPPLVSVPTGDAYIAALMTVASDLDAFEYTGSEQESVEAPIAAGGFFIGWLLDPYHDTAVYAIAAEGGASPGQGCKLDNGTFPDLCRPGTVPFQVGEVKYDTVWSMTAGQAQLAGYLGSTKNGTQTAPGAFMEGMRYISVGGVLIAYGSATGTPGLYFYRVAGFSVPLLIENRARAREHSYEPATAAAAIAAQNDVLSSDPEGEFVPALALAENSAPAGSSSPSDDLGDGGGGDGGLQMPNIPLPNVDPGPVIVATGTGLVGAAAVIWALGT